MTEVENSGFKFRWYHFFGGLFLTFLLAFAVIFFWFRSYFYASPLTPVELSAKEEQTLEKKLEQLSGASSESSTDSAVPAVAKVPAPAVASGEPEVYDENELEPEPYSEDDSKRTLFFTEKELNSMIAKNEDMAENVSVDLADDLVSVKWLVHMPDDLIFLGGKTLKLNLGAKVAFVNDQPVIELKGVSLGGVPIPNAWLGELKHKDLVKEFGEDGGFWQKFKEGIEELEIVEGAVRIRLKE